MKHLMIHALLTLSTCSAASVGISQTIYSCKFQKRTNLDTTSVDLAVEEGGRFYDVANIGEFHSFIHRPALNSIDKMVRVSINRFLEDGSLKLLARIEVPETTKEFIVSTDVEGSHFTTECKNEGSF